jgi:hypothetical protein
VDVVFHEFNPFWHQRRRRHCRIAPRHPHLDGVSLRRRRRVLLRRCPPASDGRRLSRRAAGGGPRLRGRAPAWHLPPDRPHAAHKPAGARVSGAKVSAPKMTVAPKMNRQRMSGPLQYKWVLREHHAVEGHMHAIARTISTLQTKFQFMEIFRDPLLRQGARARRAYPVEPA